LDVMHLDGNENHGEPANLAHGCRSCNGKLAAAFKRIGAGVPTNQYNPAKGGVPTFEQYAWAITQGEGGQHHHYKRGEGWQPGAHDEAGAIIHATPKSKRIQYARRLVGGSRRNMWPFGEGQALGSRVYHGKARVARRASAPKLTARQEAKSRREQESERLESKLSDRELNRKLQQHYARGGNLAEYLQANPAAARDWERRNRAAPHSSLGDKLDRIDREILGAVDFKKRAAWLKKRAQVWKEAMGKNPGVVRVTIAPSTRRKGSYDVFVGGIHRVTKPTLKGAQGYAERIERANVDPVTASFLGDQLTKAASKLKKKATGNPGEAYGVSYKDSPDMHIRARQTAKRRGGYSSSESPWMYFETLQDLNEHLRGLQDQANRQRITFRWRAQRKEGGEWRAYDSDWGNIKPQGGKRNPSDAAASMFQKFHGRPSGEVVEVDKPVHYHAHLAALGELEKLTVKSNDGGLVDLEGFGDAVLCSNERGTQLYIEGGDQAVKLSAFGIGKPYHDVEDLGEVMKLWYFTNKVHLGDQGGEASYHHTLSEEKKTRMSYGFGERRAPKPRLLYDVLNQSLAFAGGEYSVEPEGIRN
jgi:hypothetical protein